jgi:flagellar motility protein MotE (MotC chaperone)
MKEDLQFYAKLLGLFDGVFQPSDDYVMKVINFTQAMKQENIRYEYRLHSTPELKIKLEHFFEYIYDEIQVQLYKKNRDLHEQSILNYFHEIIKQVEQDFEQKEKEYLDLHSLPLTMS